MNHIASTSILIQNSKGDILLLVEKNYVKLNYSVNVENEEYYAVGSTITVGNEKRKIASLVFIYRKHMSDFQVVVTVD
jgi:hypothetical protein